MRSRVPFCKSLTTLQVPGNQAGVCLLPCYPEVSKDVELFMVLSYSSRFLSILKCLVEPSRHMTVMHLFEVVYIVGNKIYQNNFDLMVSNILLY